MTTTTINRDDYMEGRVDFQTYYCALVDAIGRSAIETIVLLGVATLEGLRASTDPHFNDIALVRWDRQDAYIRELVHHRHMAISWSAKAQAAGGLSALKPGTICWSLAESVCVLKAAARRMVEEANAAK